MDELRWDRLRYLPLPEGGELTPGAASAWLCDELPEWLTLLGLALSEIEDSKAQDCHGVLAGDLRTMLEAALAAIDSGTPALLRRDDSDEESAAVSDMVLMVAARTHGADGPFADLYDMLFAESVKRRRALEGAA